MALSSLLAVFAACGPAPDGSEPDGTDSSGQPLSCVTPPPLPDVPATPQDLARYPWGTPLVPTSARSAHAFVYPHATDPNKFLALGFDADARQTLFYVTGYRTRSLKSFRDQFNADVTRIETSSSSLFSFSASMAGAVVPKGPSGPGPGIAEAWKAVYQNRLSSAGELFTCVSYPAAPSIPAEPQELATYPWGTRPFVPSTARSAYVILFPQPTAPSRFAAIGFDVTAGQTLFYVAGDRLRYLGPLRNQLNAELSAIETASSVPEGFSSNLGGHVLSEVKPGIGSVGGAWRAAYQGYLSDSEALKTGSSTPTRCW